VPRVIALVVQPGVEFDHTRVVDYEPTAARELSGVLDGQSQFVFEAHSTDYQRPEALAQLCGWLRDSEGRTWPDLRIARGAPRAVRH